MTYSVNDGTLISNYYPVDLKKGVVYSYNVDLGVPSFSFLQMFLTFQTEDKRLRVLLADELRKHIKDPIARKCTCFLCPCMFSL